MRHVVEARAIIDDCAARIGADRATIDRIFEGIPTDFPIIFSHRLPFAAHRLGMIGITVGARVHLLDQTRAYRPDALLLLIRHEAEHVRQQRGARLLFYPRYVLGWLGRFAVQLASRSQRGAGLQAAWHKAYRAIPAEREAYGAEREALEMLRRHTKHKPGNEGANEDREGKL